MAKFYGSIGYSVTEPKETSPGVWVDKNIERPYTGDLVRNRRSWNKSDAQASGEDKVNPDVNISEAISIVADGFMLENLYTMKYVVWRGVKWCITDVTIERPRVIIEIGGLYNGHTDSAA